MSFSPSPRLNVIVGRNGSGKTSLLEAIHVLGSGRSFRSRKAGEVISHGATGLWVSGELVGGDDRIEGIGVEKTREATRIRLSGQEVRTASRLARLLPVLLIGPDSEKLLHAGAKYRRRAIDWTLFHVEQDYLDTFHRYHRALRQRNVQLKGGTGGAVLTSWDEEVAVSGERLHHHRLQYADTIREPFGSMTRALLGQSVVIEYRPGWEVDCALAEALRVARKQDLQRGFTGLGPHRAELRFLVDGVPARAVLSRGEGKLLVAGLLLAQVVCLGRCGGRRPIVLADDLGSELDQSGRERFLAALFSTHAQAFVTVVQADRMESLEETRMFHMERGILQEMV